MLLLGLKGLLLSASFLSSVTASQLSLRNATQDVTFEEITPSATLIWYPCFSLYSCAMLFVPLSYNFTTTTNTTQASIPLIKIPAQPSTPSSYLGMLLTNPGGPGDPGVDFLLTSGISVLLPVVGSNYDIVSFDPRGMGRSIPRANCSSGGSGTNTASKLRKKAFDLSGPELTDEYWEETFQAAAELGEECMAAIGGEEQAGRYMSSPVVVRDMLSIVDAFAASEDGAKVSGGGNASELNHWGFSYGTFLGELFASSYPERVGRMVIDGVVDPADYSDGNEFSDIIDDDAAVNVFFQYCSLSGPTLCPFSTGNTTQDIKTRFDNLFTHLNASYAISQNWTNASTILDSLATIKATIRLNTYTPITTFPLLAQQLVGFETVLNSGNVTIEAIEAIEAISTGTVDPQIVGTVKILQEYLPAVVCTDVPSVFNQTYEDLRDYIGVLEKQSFVAGENWATIKVLCTGWSIEGAWRYNGSFGGDTKNPLLFVSNMVDPATPIINSQTWAPKFKDAQILTIEAVGHTSMAANNSCANEKINKFFQTGELPANGTVCGVESGAWGVNAHFETTIC